MDEPDRKTMYEMWMEEEGPPVHQTFGLSDIRSAPLGDWPRLGARGAFVQLAGLEGLTGVYLLEIPPGASTTPEHHLFEEVFYVLNGRGAAEVWSSPSSAHVGFEWQRGSLFSPPLNTWHSLTNLSGSDPALVLGVTTAPLILDLFQNADFVFQCDHPFSERYDGGSEYFAASDERWETGSLGRPTSVWETNLIPDVRNARIDLQGAPKLGKLSTMYEMSKNVLGGHIEDWPPGLHDMAHYHGGGAVILALQGTGYSLMWPQEAGVQPYANGHADQVVRIDWSDGSIYSPPTRWFHQHFNSGRDRIRFLAVHFDLARYGVGFWDAHAGTGVLRSVREGGTQISYEDQDPKITRQYHEALAKVGVETR